MVLMYDMGMLLYLRACVEGGKRMFRSGNSIGRQSFSVMSGWISSGLKTVTETAKSAFTKGALYVVPMLPYTETPILSKVQTQIHETLIKKCRNQKQTKAIDRSLTSLFGNHKSIIYAFIYKHIVQLYQQANQIDLETLYSIMLTSEGQTLLRDVLLSEQGINLIATIMSIVYPQHAPNVSSAMPFLKSVLGHPAMKSIITDLGNSDLVRSQMRALILDPDSDKFSLANLLVQHPQFQNIVAKVMLDNGQFSKNGSQLMRHILSENGISGIGNCMSIVYPQHAPKIGRALPFINATLQLSAVRRVITGLLNSAFGRGKMLDCVVNPAVINEAFGQQITCDPQFHDIVNEVMFKGEGGKLNDNGRQLMRHLLSKEAIAFIADLDSNQAPNIRRAFPFISATLQQAAVQKIIIGLPNSPFVREKMLECVRSPEPINASFAQELLLHRECQDIVRNVMLDDGKLNGIGRQLMCHLLSEDGIAFIDENKATLYTEPESIIARALPVFISLLEYSAMKRIIVDLPNSAFVRGTILDCVAAPGRIQSSLALELLRHVECHAIVQDAILERGRLNDNGRTLMDHILSQEVIAFIASYLRKIPNIADIRQFLDQPTIKSIIIGLLDSAYVREKILECVSDPDCIQASLVQDLLRQRDCQAIVGRVMLESKKGKLNVNGRELIAHLLSEESMALMSNSISIVYPKGKETEMSRALSFLISVLGLPAVKSIIPGLANSAFVRGKLYELIHDQEVETDVLALDLLRHRDCQDIARKVGPEDAIALIRHILSEKGVAFFNYIKSILYSQDQGSEMNRKLSFLIPVLGLPAVKSIIPGLANSAFVREKMYELIHNPEVDKAALALDLLRNPECQAIVEAIMFEDGQFSDNGRALMKHILSAEVIALIGNSMLTLYPEQAPEMIQFLTSVVQHPAMTEIILGLANYSKFREIIFEYVINPVEVFEKYKFAIEIIYDPTCQEIVRSVMAGISGQELVSERILSVAGKQHIANFITNVLSTQYTVKELDYKIEQIGYIIQLADELASQTQKTSEHLSTFHNYIRSVLQRNLSENVQAYFIDPVDPLGKIKRYEKSPEDSPREVVFVHRLMNLIFDLSNIFKAIEELPLQRRAGFTNLAIDGVFSEVLKIWDDANVLIKGVLEFSADLDVIESQIFGDENLLEKIEHLINQDDFLGNLYHQLKETTVVFPKINLGKWLGMFIQSFGQENKDNKLMLFISKLPQYLERIATEFELKLGTLKKDGASPANLKKLNNAQEKLNRIATDLKRISQKGVAFELNIMSLIYHGPQIWSLGKEIFESGQHVLLYSAQYTEGMLSKLKYDWFLEAIFFLDRCENNFFIKRGTFSDSRDYYQQAMNYYQKAIANIAPLIHLAEDSQLRDFNDLSELRFERSAIEYTINDLWLNRYVSHQKILTHLIQTKPCTGVDQLRADLEQLSPYMRRVDDLWYRNSYLELSKDKPNFKNILDLAKLKRALIHLHQELNSSLVKKERFLSEFDKELIIRKSTDDKVKICAQKDFEAQVDQVKKVACLAPALELAIHRLWLERYDNHSQLKEEGAAITGWKIAQLQRASSIDEVSRKQKVKEKAIQIYEAQVSAQLPGCFKIEDTEQRGYFNSSTLLFSWLNVVASGAEDVVTQVYSNKVSDHMKSLETDRPLSAFHLESKVVVNGLRYLSTVWTILQTYEPTHFQDSQHNIGFDQIARNAELIWNGHQLFLSYSALSIHELQLMLHQFSNSFRDLLPKPDVLDCMTETRDHVREFWFLMAPQLVAYLAEPANNQLTIPNIRNIADLSRVHGEKLDSILEHSGSYSLLWYFFDIKELVLQSQSNMSTLAKQLHTLMISSTFKMNILEKFDQIVCTLGINPKLAQDLVQSMRGFFLEVLIYSMSSPKDLRKCYQDMSAFKDRVEEMSLRHVAILESISKCQSLISIRVFTEQHKKALYAVLGCNDDLIITSEEALAQLQSLQSRLEFEASLIVQHIEHLEQQPQELSRHGQHLNVFDALCQQFIIERQSRFIDYQQHYQTAISQFFYTQRVTLSAKCEELTEEQFEPEVNRIFEKFDREHKGFHQKYEYLQTLLDIVKQIEDKLQAVNPDQDWFDDEDTREKKQKRIAELKELFNIDAAAPATDGNLRKIHDHIMDFTDFNEVMSEWCPVSFNAPHLGVVGDLLGWLWGCIYELARWFISLCYEPAGHHGLVQLQNASMRFFPPANVQISQPPIGLPVPCV